MSDKSRNTFMFDERRQAVEPAALRAWAQGRTIYMELHDGRIIGFPADRFRILAAATEEQLARGMRGGPPDRMLSFSTTR